VLGRGPGAEAAFGDRSVYLERIEPEAEHRHRPGGGHFT
jgi:hypothetical protein